MKKKSMFKIVVVTFFCLINIQVSLAQSWNIAGNGNATTNSKLGTTNSIPLRVFTNNQERLRVDPAGNIGIGTTTPLNLLTLKLSGSVPVASWTSGGSLPAFLAFGENMSTGFNLATASDIFNHRPVVNFRRSRGTLAAPTRVANNDYLASFVASGYDGGNFQNPASIDFYVDATPTPGNVPGRISFVTGTNVGNRKERLQVGSTGNFNFNNGQLFIQQTNGYIGIGTNIPSSQLEVNGTGTLKELNVSGNTNIHTSGGFGKLNVESDDPSSPADGGTGIYAVGRGLSGIGVMGKGGYGVYGSTVEGTGIFGYATGDGSDGDGPGRGVSGISDYGIALYGYGVTGVEVNGSDYGFYGTTHGTGVYATTDGDATGSNTVDGIPGYAGQFISTNYRGIYASGNPGYYAGYFNGSVFSTGTFTTSDMRLKKNIKDISGAMQIINLLKPKNYEFRNDGNYATMNLPHGSHYGLLAQDLEKVLPNLVKGENHQFDDAKAFSLTSTKEAKTGIIKSSRPKKEKSDAIDVKAVNYDELIPIVIKAMQEQNKQITDLQGQLNDLKALIFKTGNTSATSAGYLKQNVPNPAGNSTIVHYQLPENTRAGQLTISDMKGSVLKIYNVTKATSEVTIKSGELPAGLYSYTLYADGNPIDTKQIVIAK